MEIPKITTFAEMLKSLMSKLMLGSAVTLGGAMVVSCSVFAPSPSDPVSEGPASNSDIPASQTQSKGSPTQPETHQPQSETPINLQLKRVQLARETAYPSKRVRVLQQRIIPW